MKRNYLLFLSIRKSRRKQKEIFSSFLSPFPQKKEKLKIKTINFLSYLYCQGKLERKKKGSECTTSAIFSSNFLFLFLHFELISADTSSGTLIHSTLLLFLFWEKLVVLQRSAFLFSFIEKWRKWEEKKNKNVRN